MIDAARFRHGLVLAAALLLSCGAARNGPSASSPGSGTRVLFIGNSLTTTNDVPALVEGLAELAGAPVTTHTVASGGFSLEDHWSGGDARRAIAQGGWSFVVLQQGPSALPESQVLLREYTRRFDAEIRRVGARSALYMVWPSAARAFDFDGVRASYASAASDVGGLLLPAGEAWRAAWRRDPAIALYGPDGFHQSPLGSYLAALVIHQQITGRAPVSAPSRLPARGGAPEIMLTAAQARLLQEAAAEANGLVAGTSAGKPGP